MFLSRCRHRDAENQVGAVRRAAGLGDGAIDAVGKHRSSAGDFRHSKVAANGAGRQPVD